MDDSGCEGCFVRVTVVGMFLCKEFQRRRVLRSLICRTRLPLRVTVVGRITIAFGCGTYKVPLQRLIVVIVILRLTAKLTEFSIEVNGSRLLPLQR